MHDGRFPTFYAVIDHYSTGGQKHPNKDVRIQPLHLTTSEKAAFLAFLETLTDPHLSERPALLGSVQSRVVQLEGVTAMRYGCFVLLY